MAQARVRPRQVAAYQSLRLVTVDEAATCGAQIGVNLLLPDGTLGTVAALRALFGGTGSTTTVVNGNTLGSSDDLQEGQFNQWFTARRAQDAVAEILVDTGALQWSYTAGSIRAAFAATAAAALPYDPSSSGLSATDVQGALDELSTGGGGGAPSRQTISASTTGGSPLTGTLAIGAQALALQLVSDQPCRLRLYTTAALRDADLSRDSATDPAAGSGLLLEYLTTASFLGGDLSPVPTLYNGDSPVGSTIAFTLEPATVSSTTATLTYMDRL